jgi:hypothetical protein
MHPHLLSPWIQIASQHFQLHQPAAAIIGVSRPLAYYGMMLGLSETPSHHRHDMYYCCCTSTVVAILNPVLHRIDYHLLSLGD